MSDRSDLKSIVAAAKAEAAGSGSPRLEAEHLLLALTVLPRLSAGKLLAEEGLDHETLRAALDSATARSLQSVGISLADFSLPAEIMPARRQPEWGQTAKLAFHRAIKVQRAPQTRLGRGRGRRFNSLHLLLGILQGEGTVPRALAAASVDRTTLADCVRERLREGAA